MKIVCGRRRVRKNIVLDHLKRGLLLQSGTDERDTLTVDGIRSGGLLLHCLRVLVNGFTELGGQSFVQQPQRKKIERAVASPGRIRNRSPEDIKLQRVACIISQDMQALADGEEICVDAQVTG